jgi:DNA-binding transcriptional ArsR family regulator
MRISVYIRLVLDATLSVATRWELYRVLSEPVRLRLLALAAEEELAIGELAELLGESQPNVSRHAGPLRQAGLLSVRRQGTRTLVRTPEGAMTDPVVSDAVASGRALCESDGSLSRVADVLAARDAVAREFFARPRTDVDEAPTKPASELGAYLRAFAPLLPDRALAIDAGTGDGGLLDVLAPTFEKVLAVDRSDAQLALARDRVRARGYDNVVFALGELDGPDVVRAVGDGADAVFAVRMLHHAARPPSLVKQLAELCRPGGAVVVLDYARHDDESMRDQADLWLGFEPSELRRFARAAGLEHAEVIAIPSSLNGRGPDAHLAWQVMVARKNEGAGEGGRRRQMKKGKEHDHG